MSWETEYQGIVEDLRFCHWEDFSELKFDIIKRDLRKTLKRAGKLDYQMFPPTFRWHLCSSRLSQGKFDNWDGWEFRSNWSITFQGLNGFNMPIRKWDGKPVKHLIIASEQGIGDEICYASAIPELMVRLGPKALELQCHPRLIPIFERSFGIKCTERKVLSEIEGESVVALADLFMFYRRDKVHFPKKSFLRVNPDKKAKWLDYLKDFPKPWIGTAYKSRHGVIELPKLEGSVFNLQYGEGLSDALNDMEDHLALVSCMDQIVSVTQTLVHEAGALDVPCDAIKPPKGSGEVDCHLWYYSVGNSPHGHTVYGSVRVFESIEEYKKCMKESLR